MAESNSNILVPIGFSEQSILALEQALIFAKATSAKIALLSVIEESNFFKKIFSAKTDGNELRKKVITKLKNLAKKHSDRSGIEISTMVARGVVYEEIVRVSELIEAILVILGTNGKPQNFQKRFIGNNAYRVATLVQPPVITVNGVRNIHKISTIIFPLVLDRRSKEKVGPALKYARLFNANIKVVSVAMKKYEVPILRSHLKQVETFVRDCKVECASELIENPKQKGIIRNTLNYAYENDGDLIIITEDDKDKDLSGYFLGTDVQAMIYYSEIPVMIITPSKVKWETMWESF